MKSTTIKLADRSYKIQMLPMRKNRAWREKAAQPYAELISALEGANEIVLIDDENKVQFSTIAGVVKSFAGTLIGSMDTLMNLLFEYSPELAKDRDWIEENAYDDEALKAFTEVLKLAYPFGAVLEMVSGLRGESKT